jgi:hypothetical protein
MSAGRLLGLVIAFVIGFLLLLGIREGLAAASSLGYEPSVLHAVRTGPHSAKLSISTWPDSVQCHPNGPHPDWVSYCSSTTWQVPANSTITVTVTQYDGGDLLHNNFFSRVHGTIGGTETINGKTVHGLNQNDPLFAHTLTIQSLPNSPAQLFVSVPMKAVPDSAPTPLTINGTAYPKPNVITFRFRSGRAGQYIWHCYVPCGSGLSGSNEGFGGPMSTTGYMAGVLTVTG